MIPAADLERVVGGGLVKWLRGETAPNQFTLIMRGEQIEVVMIAVRLKTIDLEDAVYEPFLAVLSQNGKFVHTK